MQRQRQQQQPYSAASARDLFATTAAPQLPALLALQTPPSSFNLMPGAHAPSHATAPPPPGSPFAATTSISASSSSSSSFESVYPPWSAVSLFVLSLSEELLVELLQFAGRDWRLAAFNMRLLREQLDGLVGAALAYCSHRLSWEELHISAHAMLASLTAAISVVLQFVQSKEAECVSALQELTSDQRWRDAQWTAPQRQSALATEARSLFMADRLMMSRFSSLPPTFTSQDPAATSSIITTSNSALPDDSLPLVSSFSPGMSLSFARVVFDIHPRESHELLPDALYHRLLADAQLAPSDVSDKEGHATHDPQWPSPVEQRSSADFTLCRTLLSISRCMDHLMRFHLLHHLALFHLLAAFQRALLHTGPLSTALFAAYNVVAIAPMANTATLLSLCAQLALLMQTLQVGHTGLVGDQQRQHQSLRCASCQGLISMPPVTLQCGHSVCYMCMLWRVRTIGASCMHCGENNTMAQLHIDTLKSALALTPISAPVKQELEYQQQQATSQWPMSAPHSQPFAPAAVLPWTSHVSATTSPVQEGGPAASSSNCAPATLPTPGRGDLHLSHSSSVGAEHGFQSRDISQACSLSSSTSSVYSSTCSSMSPSPSESPLSSSRSIAIGARRASVPNLPALLLSGSSGAPSPSSSNMPMPSAERRPLVRGRSRSARKLSDTFIAAGSTASSHSSIARRAPHIPLPPVAIPLSPVSTQTVSSSRSSPVPLMATVVEPPNDGRVLAAPEPRISPSSISSCHQCKSAKPRQSLMVCSSPAERTANRQRKCRKKYCLSCLQRCYNWPFVANATDWSCPACEGVCICASCQRGRELRSMREAAAGASMEMNADSAAKRESTAIKQQA